MQVLWTNVVFFFLCHCLALQGLYFLLLLKIKWQTIIWLFFLRYASFQGVTAGVHRLWSHRSYKATLPLRILLCFLHTIAFQNSIFAWARDHRVHHKFSDTDADPHNVTRGFFFSHIGWLLMDSHPKFLEKVRTMDVTDLEEDSVVQFQRKYYFFLAVVCCFIFPTLVPWYFWGEDWYLAFVTAGMLRYVITLHCIFLVNSAAHTWGYRPYDKNMKPTDNTIIAKVTQGEGWHNYHHTFPWDYKAAELDTYNGNLTVAFIDFMTKIGWAYDLKTASKELVEKRKKRTGTPTKNVISVYSSGK